MQHENCFSGWYETNVNQMSNMIDKQIEINATAFSTVLYIFPLLVTCYTIFVQLFKNLKNRQNEEHAL